MSRLELYRISGWLIIAIWLLLSGIIIYKKLPQWRFYKYFYIYVLLITLLEFVYMTLAILRIHNLFLDYFYKSIEFITLTFYLQTFFKSKKYFTVAIVLSILFIAFQLINAFYGEGFVNFNSIGNLINSIYLTIFSLYLLIKLLTNNRNFDLLNKSDSNILLGIFLIYLFDILGDILLKFTYQQNNATFMYIVLISRNFIKIGFLLLFIRGVRLIKF